VSSITKTSIRLIWSQVSWGSTEADDQAFLSYEVWRNSEDGQIPGVATSFEIIFTTGDITHTTYTDADAVFLANGGVGYYTIVVKDTFGQVSYSNEEEGGTVP